MYVDVVESFLAAARGSSESGNKDGVEGVVNDERDTATTTRINRKSAITTKGMVAGCCGGCLSRPPRTVTFVVFVEGAGADDEAVEAVVDGAPEEDASVEGISAAER
ncbi:hypothetical protein PRIPAC_94038 [Pristionchus pacificus]|uniref:Uncharacterized protein n=1 Tax=Pristionchus pacificus TaxID=54126 RepID=A0A2A6CDP5_PRIPA|nr:hypothetical protein PRIPAC_94038 [Pristionchus pacificus]|eukprot:PDM76208.1 hypothetical protein PRIPAC_39812 [Pristionchus pacificus]